MLQGILDGVSAAASPQADRHRAFLAELDPQLCMPTLEAGPAAQQGSLSAASDGKVAAQAQWSSMRLQYASARSTMLHGLDAQDEAEQAGGSGRDAGLGWPTRSGSEERLPKRPRLEPVPSGDAQAAAAEPHAHVCLSDLKSI